MEFFSLLQAIAPSLAYDSYSFKRQLLAAVSRACDDKWRDGVYDWVAKWKAANFEEREEMIKTPSTKGKP